MGLSFPSCETVVPGDCPGTGNRRTGRDRLHLFRIAAGSADETETHQRVAEAWGDVARPQTEAALQLADRELAILYRLAH